MSNIAVDKAIIKERKDTFGNSFPIIAGLWNNYLNNCIQNDHITPEDAAVMLALLKIARLSVRPTHEDSMIDMLNYLWIAFNYDEYLGIKYE